ncbi:MAG: hypothetical protein HUJ85_00735 [Veillonella sp.]|nr:hypothetical protein [Veillonella sp.]
MENLWDMRNTSPVGTIKYFKMYIWLWFSYMVLMALLVIFNRNPILIHFGLYFLNSLYAFALVRLMYKRCKDITDYKCFFWILLCLVEIVGAISFTPFFDPMADFFTIRRMEKVVISLNFDGWQMAILFGALILGLIPGGIFKKKPEIN